ncbi:GNAT family N-acetyltransferase [Methylobacterium terricola]|uniref:GNAT family N-acetyltransferase n=1 Tax=Methylobacterium terricola TaxID=2583531 RepID=A0A5C4LJ27_9HYPH|nr:GNAT family N-acetyltransferase [Methylobacterium terricola]TNC12894.1 GNAT family N-acetyltransferase [Methylobacterium terricola]
MSAAPSETDIIRVPASSTLGKAALKLRHEVFVVEQGVPVEVEIDADDPTATHFVALVEGEIAGTLRVVFKPEHAKIGRVVVHRDRRGSGIARKMMICAMDYCRGIGVGRFYLTAQTDKLGFYEKLGFAAFGAEFMDAGIPHLAMKTY